MTQTFSEAFLLFDLRILISVSRLILLHIKVEKISKYSSDSHLCFIQVSEKWNYFEPPSVTSTTYKAQIYINTNLLFFITPILKSLVVPIIWLALTDVIYSQIAPFFALNRIFFPANEEATLKTKQPVRFQGLFNRSNC